MTPALWLVTGALVVLAIFLAWMVVLLKRVAEDAFGDVLDSIAHELR